MKRLATKKRSSTRKRKYKSNKTKTIGRGTKYSQKGMVNGGHTPGQAKLTVRIGGKAFSFDSTQLARLSKIRKAQRALSLPTSQNGGGRL